MGRKGIKSSITLGGVNYFSHGVAHKHKSSAKKVAKSIRKKGGKARIRKYTFGYVVYGRT